MDGYVLPLRIESGRLPSSLSFASNVESCFSMMKRKFGDSLRSRTDVAMVNEALAKIVCHNLT